MSRVLQVLLIATFLPLCWLGFLAVHESGHVLAAWCTGGTVDRVVLHPTQISWTALAHNPHPLLVAWGGPVLGAALPGAFLAIAHRLRALGVYPVRFFTGFCLVANGSYLLVDAFTLGGDSGTLVANGASFWQLMLFAAITVPLGFRLWHGLGPWFGLGKSHGRVSRRAVIGSMVILGVVVLLELALGQ